MWVPHFGDWAYAVLDGTTGWLEMAMLMRDCGQGCDVACGAVRWKAKLWPKRTSLLPRRLIGCVCLAGLASTLSPQLQEMNSDFRAGLPIAIFDFASIWTLNCLCRG